MADGLAEGLTLHNEASYSSKKARAAQSALERVARHIHATPGRHGFDPD
jgi:hypothetical protein